MRIEHHLVGGCSPTEEIKDKDGKMIPNPHHHNIWLTNDGLLTSWLLGIISEEVLCLVEGKDSACRVWASLEELFLSNTKEMEIHLKEALLCLKKGNSSLDEYVKKFKSLSDKLAAMKHLLDDLTKVFHLAWGLGSKYKDFRIAML